ncbi:MAG: cupin domain-containing protein [Desulfuromonadales bacterium]|jgi:transcriptional regulator with XRE-family HTH domain|uniref:cupin domain-containing protein n=1 Tax=Desulfuromonas sp. KJ2020 TaxID=2919173 RepID=UPI000325538F|nr:cupin domain-containing protein [Desulfuromonas sp. KJ2020]MCP3176580.1 cupin domain-containing protein [Desulfuromonas sp. KJ2020]
MENIRDEVKELQIGLKIRRMRQERRMTLQDLAEGTGLSKPLLSQIENEQVIPPLATLLRISKAFKVELHTFFQEESDSEKCILVRAGESRQLRQWGKQGDSLPPYSYHSLAYGKKNRHLEPFVVEFEARQWRDDLQVSHDGEEFLFLLEGQLEFRYGDQVMQLNPGDSVYYDSSEPHGYIATTDLPTRAVAVLYSRS